MPVDQLYIIKGKSYTNLELKQQELIPSMKVLPKIKDLIIKLLEKHTPKNETSIFITNDDGTVTFIYSLNFNNSLFKKEFNSYPFMLKELSKGHMKI
jgi:hypothetical protein